MNRQWRPISASPSFKGGLNWGLDSSWLSIWCWLLTKHSAKAESRGLIYTILGLWVVLLKGLVSTSLQHVTEFQKQESQGIKWECLWSSLEVTHCHVHHIDLWQSQRSTEFQEERILNSPLLGEKNESYFENT